MVTVLGMWEPVWMDPERTERRLWKQTIEAFAVDQWGMCAVHGGPFTSPVQFADAAAMLAAYPGPKTFLIPPGRLDGLTLGVDYAANGPLKDYVHPENAIYVFGSGNDNLVAYLTAADDVVEICTPAATDMFGPVAMGVALYDRCRKIA
jgi:hypothetical protein